MVAFAPEIVDMFLSHLNKTRGRFQYLRDCALVCRTWRPIAQRLLFVDIYLATSSSVTQLEAVHFKDVEGLANVLRHAPHLAQMIARHTIIGDVGSPHQGMLGITPFVTHAKHIVICRFLTLPEQAAVIHPDVLQALPNVFSSTRLTTLDFFYLNDVRTHLFRHCLALQHLVLRYTTITTSHVEDVVATADTRIHLKGLSFAISGKPGRLERETFAWLMKPSCPFDFSELQLFLGCDRESLPNALFYRFMLKHPDSLEYLLIDPFQLPNQPTSFLSLTSKLVSLRAIEIPIKCKAVEDRVASAVAFLSNLPMPNLLRRVVIHFHYPTSQKLEKSAPLEEYLASQALPKLREVVAILYWTKSQTQDMSISQQIFPLLRAKKLLSVEVAPAGHYADFVPPSLLLNSSEGSWWLPENAKPMKE